MLPVIKAHDVQAHIIGRTADVLIDELRATDDLPSDQSPSGKFGFAIKSLPQDGAA